MSSAGQIVGGAIGAVAGTVIPGVGTFLGAQLGMMLGGYLDPPAGPVTEGPRLSDLTVQTSTYGAVLPSIDGTDAVAGNVFWLQGNKIDETPVKKKTGGKGGSKKTTITWVNTATFAVGLCKGPIVGVRRIWLKGELYYDAGSTDFNTVLASNAAAAGFRVYRGANDQMPDPRIQADLGVDNTPAWRGRAYIVFYDLDLAPYGNSLVGTQVKVEVYAEGSYDYYVPDRHDMPVAHQYAFTAWNGSMFVRLANFVSSVFTSYDGITWTETTTGFGTSVFWQGLVYANGVFVAPSYQAGMPVWVSPDGINWTSNTLPMSCGPIAYGAGTFVVSNSNSVATSPNGTLWTVTALPENNGASGSRILYNGSVFLVWMDSIGKVMTSSTGTSGWVSSSLALNNHNFGVVKGGVFYLGSNGGFGVQVSADGMNWTQYGIMPHTQSMAADDNNIICFGNDSFAISTDGITWTDFPATLHNAGPYVAGCWNGAVISVANTIGAAAYNIFPFVATPSTTTLGDIVSKKCLSTNLLTAGDIDVTQLTDVVRGYTDASTGPIRGSLEPLQLTWPFDVRQHGYKIQFVRRGGSYTTTINADDLDARGAGSAPGVRITEAREMNLQLPKQVNVKYKDSDREYAVGEQYAERLNTSAVNEVSYELAVVMNATEAAVAADVLLYMRWMERVDLSFSLPATYNLIESGDVVLLPLNGSFASVRVVTVNYTTDNRLEITGKFANPSTYVSSAVGVPSAVTGQTTISLPGVTEYVLLDVPILHTAQLDPSFLVSMYGGSNWQGGVLMRSDDSGTTWNDLQGFASPGGTVGTANNTIGSVDSRTWDNASELSVTVVNGDLYSATAEAVLNGSNYFAYGADGRWEIIAVQNCNLVSTNLYKLRDMLRGRYGTEWAMTTHQVGDKVVLLSVSDVTTIGMSAATIGSSRVYRGVTLDADISTAADRSFTYNGVNLKPYAPVHLHGARVVNSYDWKFTWVARSRTDGEWRDGVSVVISEPVEAYELVVYSDNTYTTVKRTIAVSTPVATYTEAQQTTDFGGAQTNVYVRVYQLSSVVGLGYATEKSIVAQGGFVYWSSVVLQLGMQGVNNSTVFTDDKLHTITPAGNAKISTAQHPFTTPDSSAYFDGSGDYLSLPTSSDWAFGTGDFCVEAWVYVVSLPGGAVDNDLTVFGRITTAPIMFCYIDRVTGKPTIWDNALGVTCSTAVTLGAWNHVAWTRQSGTMRVFLNGVLGATQAGYTTNFSATSEFFVGGTATALRYFNGYIGPLRVTKGYPVYTSSFAVPTGPYPTF